MYQYNSLLSQPMVMPAPPDSPYTPPDTTQQFGGGPGQTLGGYGGGRGGGGSFASYLNPRSGGYGGQYNPYSNLREEAFQYHPHLRYRAQAYSQGGQFDQRGYEYQAMQDARRRGKLRPRAGYLPVSGPNYYRQMLAEPSPLERPPMVGWGY